MTAFKCILFFTSLFATMCAQDFHISSKSRKRTYFENNIVSHRILWVVYNLSLSRCHAGCSSDERCSSFFYNKVTDKCQGHSVTFGSTTIAVVDPNTKYYVTQWGESYIGDSCVTSSDCVTIISECRDGMCLCVPGYSFSPRTHECLSDCSSFGSEFLEVKSHYIAGTNQEAINGISLETCRELCLSRTSYMCRTFEYGHATYTCTLASETKLNNEHRWSYSSTISYYQRDCD